VEHLKLKAQGEVQPVLDQYELDLDKSLIALEKMTKEAENDMLKGGEGAAMFDPTKIETMMKRFYDAAKELRDTNREYARKLSQVMDEDSRAKFTADFKSRAFPRVYKPAHITKLLDEAAKFSELSADQKKTIAELHASYDREASGLNDRWAKAVEEREDKAGGVIPAMMKSMQGQGGELNKDVNEARTARKELDDKTKEKLKGLLSEEQIGKLPPAPPANPNPWADFMPQPDEEDSQ
jgi:hypothetical protein